MIEMYPLYEEPPQMRDISAIEVSAESETDRSESDTHDRMRKQWRILNEVAYASTTVCSWVLVMLTTRALNVAWLSIALACVSFVGVSAMLILSWRDTERLQKTRYFGFLVAVGIASAISFHQVIYYAYLYYYQSLQQSLLSSLFKGILGLLGGVTVFVGVKLTNVAVKRKLRGY